MNLNNANILEGRTKKKRIRKFRNKREREKYLNKEKRMTDRYFRRL